MMNKVIFLGHKFTKNQIVDIVFYFSDQYSCGHPTKEHFINNFIKKCDDKAFNNIIKDTEKQLYFYFKINDVLLSNKNIKLICQLLICFNSKQYTSIINYILNGIIQQYDENNLENTHIEYTYNNKDTDKNIGIHCMSSNIGILTGTSGICHSYDKVIVEDFYEQPEINSEYDKLLKSKKLLSKNQNNINKLKNDILHDSIQSQEERYKEKFLPLTRINLFKTIKNIYINSINYVKSYIITNKEKYSIYFKEYNNTKAKEYSINLIEQITDKNLADMLTLFNKYDIQNYKIYNISIVKFLLYAYELDILKQYYLNKRLTSRDRLRIIQSTQKEIQTDIKYK